MGIKTINVIFLLGTIFSFFSCGNLDNPKERNILVFNERITSISESLKKMNEILISEKEIFTYGIDVNMYELDRNENDFFLYI